MNRALGRIAACIGGLALLPSLPVLGQAAIPHVMADSTLPVGTVKGQVVGWTPTGDSTNVLRVFREVLVSDQQTGKRITTAGDGTFALTGLKPGLDTITARFIGFDRTVAVIQIPSHGGLRLLLVMAAAKIVSSNDSFRVH